MRLRRYLAQPHGSPHVIKATGHAVVSYDIDCGVARGTIRESSKTRLVVGISRGEIDCLNYGASLN